jgi:hypothetical protein
LPIYESLAFLDGLLNRDRLARLYVCALIPLGKFFQPASVLALGIVAASCRVEMVDALADGANPALLRILSVPADFIRELVSGYLSRRR